jgi:hypothetical protein
MGTVNSRAQSVHTATAGVVLNHFTTLIVRFTMANSRTANVA